MMYKENAYIGCSQPISVHIIIQVTVHFRPWSSSLAQKTVSFRSWPSILTRIPVSTILIQILFSMNKNIFS